MTRADRNQIAEAEVPEVNIPDGGAPLWDLFWRLREFKDRDDRLTPRDLSDLSGLVKLGPLRLDLQMIPMLFAMDRKFLETMAEEVANNERRRKSEGG